MKLGVLQGRLSEPYNGNIQEFPSDTWQEEFNLIKKDKLNLNHIEWIITKDSFKDNPLFTEDLSKLPISSICCDHLITPKIQSNWFLKDKLDPVCKYAIKNNIKNITIPLLEQSSMDNDKNRYVFINIIKPYGLKYKELNFSFEMELHPLKQLEIVNKCDNFYITYDCGNMTSCGYDHGYSLYHLHKKINNLHLKDRDYEGNSLPPGEGKTDFELIFNLLDKYKYTGFYTIQTARGISGEEINTIHKHKNYFLNLMNKVKII